MESQFNGTPSGSTILHIPGQQPQAQAQPQAQPQLQPIGQPQPQAQAQAQPQVQLMPVGFAPGAPVGGLPVLHQSQPQQGNPLAGVTTWAQEHKRDLIVGGVGAFIATMLSQGRVPLPSIPGVGGRRR